MGKLTKNQKLAAEKIEAGKAYSLKEAAQLVKDITFSKFDASLDIDVRLGVDPRKANQMVRGVVSLPHGTGKQVRVLVLCTPDAEAAAKEAGADYVGLAQLLQVLAVAPVEVRVLQLGVKKEPASCKFYLCSQCNQLLIHPYQPAFSVLHPSALQTDWQAHRRFPHFL